MSILIFILLAIIYCMASFIYMVLHAFDSGPKGLFAGFMLLPIRVITKLLGK